jgi:hypothetical protein
METKDELIKHIKDWMDVDSELKDIQRRAKVLRTNKKQLSESLVDVMKRNEIDCFDINNGKLIYTRNKVKSALNKKHLITALLDYFNNDAKTAQDISEHILETRQVKIIEGIRHRLN